MKSRKLPIDIHLLEVFLLIDQPGSRIFVVLKQQLRGPLNNVLLILM